MTDILAILILSTIVIGVSHLFNKLTNFKPSGWKENFILGSMDDSDD